MGSVITATQIINSLIILAAMGFKEIVLSVFSYRDHSFYDRADQRITKKWLKNIFMLFFYAFSSFIIVILLKPINIEQCIYFGLFYSHKFINKLFNEETNDEHRQWFLYFKTENWRSWK